MGFPTEQEIYHRLRWDPRFAVHRCSITVRGRSGELKRVAYLELDTNVVPWHRIVEFWLGDELIWSRPGRIDRLDELAVRATSDAEPSAAPVGTTLATWEGPSFGTTPSTPRAPLRVVAWNLLFDRYDAERLRSLERWQDALDRLAALDADVIVLVEVTRTMWQLVLAQPWVQHYMASHDASAPLAPYGQTILSRLPIRDARSLPLDGGKRATVATVEQTSPTGTRWIGIAAIHLTSNRKPDALAIRRGQLASLLEYVDSTRRDGWIVAGDFNGPPDELAPPGIDAWAAIHADAPGDTFDVVRNPLAAAATMTGRSARMDRIHARGMRVESCTLVGESLGPCGLPPSDHYGVVAALALVNDLATAPTSPRTALALVPPREAHGAWGPIQRIRCREDRNWQKWPPHVTLFHPFVASGWLPDAIAAVRDAVADVAPFELVLDRVEAIDERGQIVVLAPRDARPLLELYATIAAALPAVVRAGSEGPAARPYRPHLTIGRTGRRVAVTARWQVDRIVVLERADDAASYVPVAEIPLGRAVRASDDTVRTPDDAVRTSDTERRIATARVRDLAGVDVTPFGSSVYAPAHAGDLDLLVRAGSGLSGAPDAAAIVATLAAGLGLAYAGAERLRGRVDGLAVDVVVSDDPRILAGADDAVRLRDHLRAHGRHAAFTAAWPTVRQFVRARGLGHNGLGYFSSLGWAVLLAVPLVHDEALCAVAPADAFDAWLGWLATLRSHAHVALDSDEGRTREPAQLHIGAPAPPARNIARHLTPGTARTLFAELRRATLADLLDEPPPGTTLAVRGDSRATRGRYEGQALSLIRDLELRVGHVRVWGRFDAAAGDEGSEAWSQRLTVATAAANDTRAIVAAWLAAHGLDATVDAG